MDRLSLSSPLLEFRLAFSQVQLQRLDACLVQPHRCLCMACHIQVLRHARHCRCQSQVNMAKWQRRGREPDELDLQPSIVLRRCISSMACWPPACNPGQEVHDKQRM